MSEHPNWVIDLVNAVDQYEEEHASGDSCLNIAFQKIPDDILQGARITRRYLKNQAGEPA